MPCIVDLRWSHLNHKLDAKYSNEIYKKLIKAFSKIFFENFGNIFIDIFKFNVSFPKDERLVSINCLDDKNTKLVVNLNFTDTDIVTNN